MKVRTQTAGQTVKKLPVTEIVVVLLALLAGAGVYWWAHRDQGSLEQSKEVGAAIVEGLEMYRARHGTYPATLEELVPEYIPRVEPPTWGLERWRYRRFTPDDIAAAAAMAASPPGAAPAADTQGPGASAAAPGGQAGGAPGADGASAPAGGGAAVYFQLSVAANQSGYPVLYYDYTFRRWVLNN